MALQWVPSPPSVKAAVMLWFLIICPGLAFVRLMDLRTPYIEAIIAVALSLVIDATVGGVLVYAGMGEQTQLALQVIVALTAAGAFAQVVLARPSRRPASARQPEPAQG